MVFTLLVRFVIFWKGDILLVLHFKLWIVRPKNIGFALCSLWFTATILIIDGGPIPIINIAATNNLWGFILLIDNIHLRSIISIILQIDIFHRIGERSCVLILNEFLSGVSSMCHILNNLHFGICNFFHGVWWNWPHIFEHILLSNISISNLNSFLFLIFSSFVQFIRFFLVLRLWFSFNWSTFTRIYRHIPFLRILFPQHMILRLNILNRFDITYHVGGQVQLIIRCQFLVLLVSHWAEMGRKLYVRE